MELAPGLRRVGNDIVACYLVCDASGILLVDAGLPGQWRDLQAELRELGAQTADIRGVILTHGDSDHIGFAERLRAETGVPVFVHAADAERARTGAKPATAVGPVRLAAVGFFAYALRKGGMRTRYLAEVAEIADGDVLPLPGAPEIIGMPGHSPGSVAVHAPSVRAVFVGDALTTRSVLTGRRGGAPAPFTDDAEIADASLDRLAAIDADWVLPGHGAPWRGEPAELVAEVRAAG